MPLNAIFFIDIVAAVKKECDRQCKEPIPVFLDSGIRIGQHVVKALKLGATGVMVGRMPIIGAALGGVDGVKHVLHALLGDTQCTMLNSGVGTIEEIRNTLTIRRSP